MAIIDRPIQVQTGPDGSPLAFLWRGVRLQVTEILDHWREIGEWWDYDPPPERDVYRVRTGDGGVYEIEYLRRERQWYLYRIYD